jgi:hypothetical protein
VYACFASSLTVTAAAPIVNAPPAISSLLRLLLLGPERALGPAFALSASPAGAFALLPKPSTLVANLLSACTLVATTLRWGIACLCDREHARHVHDGTVPPLRSNGERLCSADIYRIFISLNWEKSCQAKGMKLPRIVRRRRRREWWLCVRHFLEGTFLARDGISVAADPGHVNCR